MRGAFEAMDSAVLVGEVLTADEVDSVHLRIDILSPVSKRRSEDTMDI